MQANKLIISLFCLVEICVLSAENLAPYGDFEAPPAELAKHVTHRFGKLSFVQEHPGDNRCAKVEITQITRGKDGTDGTHANIICHFDATPSTSYCFSFDLKGTAPLFMISIQEQGGAKPPVTVPSKLKVGASYYEVCRDWTRYEGTFKTGVNPGRCSLFVTLWHNTLYGKMFYDVGDYFLIDNVRVWRNNE